MTPPPPPVIFAAPAAEPAETRLVEWLPGVVSCDGVQVTPVVIPRPEPSIDYRREDQPQPVTRSFSFRVDADGRPLSIQEASYRVSPPLWNSDLEPALAASRFPSGPVRQECTINFAAGVVLLNQASPELLAAALMGRETVSLRPLIAHQLAGPGSTCVGHPPRPLNLHFPARDRREVQVGEPGRAVVRYDVDGMGTPININSVVSTDPQLQAAVEEAIAASRFEPDAPRTRCLVGFAPPARVTPAPDGPDKTHFQQSEACKPDASEILKLANVPFPPPFRRRAIEGWAVIRYDIAPWGDVGNVEILQAEPAYGFGTQAVTVVRSAHAGKSPTGYSGCVTTVRFKLDPEQEPGVHFAQ